MALNEKEQQVYDKFLELDIINPDYIDHFVNFCHNVYNRDYNNRRPIIELCRKVKNECMSVITTRGYEDNEDYIRRAHECNDAMWAIIKMEAQHRQFDSYCMYLEKKRDPKDKFYQPRRNVLRKHGIVQSFQQLIDDELDLLTISLPPGTGKAQPLYSKVLTPDGFKRMGEVCEGMEVIAGNGNIAHITGIYPQGEMPIYRIMLENGLKCDCSLNHLWSAQYWNAGRACYKTIALSEIMINPSKWLIPVTTSDLDNIFYLHIQSIERVGKEECQCIMIDDPCHLYITDDYIITHNTSLEKFFHSAVAGWFPKDYSLFYSHSGDITRMYYDGVYDIVTNDEEYNWHEIFPDLKVTQTNAKLEQFNVGKYKPFPSVQCTSIGAKNAGKVRASRFLFVDDLIGNIEEALNKTILEKRWSAYTTDARQRKTTSLTDGTFCKELVLMTRWSTLDPIGRLQLSYEGSDRARFIAIPDIDEKTGDSNFAYDIGGFTADNFHDVERLMDEISYRCLYKQDPIEREGLLYPEESLRRYAELPPDDPETVIGVCDTKTTGIDYMFLPIFYKYGEDYYLVDCICDDSSDFDIQYSRCTDIILRNNAKMVEFESNAGGSRIAFEVQDRVKKQGGVCSITTHPTETHKETRIIVNSEWVKRHILFLDNSKYTVKSDYGTMMNFLLSYSQMAKNKHDDVPDGLANFVEFVGRTLNHRQTRIISSPI